MNLGQNLKYKSLKMKKKFSDSELISELNRKRSFVLKWKNRKKF